MNSDTQLPQHPQTTKLPAAEERQTIPHEWPGAFGIYKYSKNAIKPNVWQLLALWVIVYALNAPSNILDFMGKDDAAWSLVSLVLSILSIFATIAVTYATLRSVDNKKVEIGESFSTTAPLFFKYLFAYILQGLLIIAGLILLIVPGLILIARTSLTTYFVIDQKLGPIAAIKASIKATKGFALKIWGILAVNILFAALLITIIGIPIALYLLLMYSAASAIAYRYVTNRAENAPASPIA